MNPKYPLYIVSKGRADTRLTSKALEQMGLFYYIVIEKQEYDIYAKVIDKSKILILPDKYKTEYDCYDKLGLTKSTGPGPARNFAWQHSIDNGDERHWVMDDNIRHFHRFNKNKKIKVTSGVFFRIMEDFVDRYENVAMAGPAYHMFVPQRIKRPPFTKNTRIYSCNLIQNNIPFRWRGRYNEDTDLSLRILKAGLCTIQFNALLQQKTVTQALKGGNTDEFYAKEGTEAKSKMLAAMHPDVAEIVYRFGRIHHFVDYKPFARNKLLKKQTATIQKGINDYGMKLVKN